jgi:hypothetical protein
MALGSQGEESNLVLQVMSTGARLPTDVPSTMSFVVDIGAAARKNRRLSSWEARHLARLFEAIAALEGEDERSWSRIWYLTLYSQFYTDIGCALLALGDHMGAEKCLWQSFNPRLESLEEAYAAMFRALGAKELAMEALQEHVAPEPQPMRLAVALRSAISEPQSVKTGSHGTAGTTVLPSAASCVRRAGNANPGGSGVCCRWQRCAWPFTAL